MRTLILAVSLLSTVVLAGEPTAMFVPKSINLEAAQVSSFGEVCAAEYARVNESIVIAPTQAQAAVGENGSLVEAARALQMREVVELTLVDLSTPRARGRLLVSAVRRGLDGKELYRADLTADSLDDAPPVCERLALSLTRQVPPSQTLNRHNVTAHEQRVTGKPNRLGAERLFGIKTAIGVPVGAEPFNPIGGIAFNARFEQEKYFIEVGLGVLIPATLTPGLASYGGLSAELGASAYLTGGDLGLYVGGGLQPRILVSSTVLGLAPYGQVGLMFARQSSTRLYVEARVSQNVLPVARALGSPASLFPTELTAQVGVGW